MALMEPGGLEENILERLSFNIITFISLKKFPLRVRMLPVKFHCEDPLPAPRPCH